MDEVSNTLREDATKIRAEVSPELDARIRASLENVSTQSSPDPRPRPRRFSMWWASSLTGITAAGLVIVLVNLDRSKPPPVLADMPTVNPLAVLELNTQPAVFTGPLQTELENLESDLRKARRAVRGEIGLTP